MYIASVPDGFLTCGGCVALGVPADAGDSVIPHGLARKAPTTSRNTPAAMATVRRSMRLFSDAAQYKQKHTTSHGLHCDISSFS